MNNEIKLCYKQRKTKRKRKQIKNNQRIMIKKWKKKNEYKEKKNKI